MKIVRHTDKNFSAQLRELTANASLFDAEIEARTKAILHEVFVRGDDAVLEFTEKFDGAKLTAEQLTVTPVELFNASLRADDSRCSSTPKVRWGHHGALLTHGG